MKEFYTTHCVANILDEEKAEEDAAIPKVMLVPTTWIRAFLETIPPGVAYERAICLKT
jgi:hypothetical protein